MNKMQRFGATLSVALLLSSCASMETLVSSPGVSLRNIEALDLGFSGQRFLLGFDVTNPNPFPLPVSTVTYSVDLDGQRFATGASPGRFTVPARGDGEFSISVELDLIRTAPQLLYIVREAVRRPIPYDLKGEFGLDIPLTDPVSFRTSGLVQLQEISRRALQAP